MRIIPLPLHRQAAGRGAPGSRLYGHNRGGGGQIWYLLVVDMPSRPDLFPRHLRIGPYLRTVAANAKWRTAEKFRYAVTKALPKLGIERPNLIVIADDLFVSPLEWEPLKRHVSSILEHFLREPAYSAVGAVLMIRPILYEKTVQYLIGFVDNEFALGHCRLPQVVSIGLGRSAGSQRPGRHR